jgi:hypothetical protein
MQNQEKDNQLIDANYSNLQLFVVDEMRRVNETLYTEGFNDEN